MSEVA